MVRKVMEAVCVLLKEKNTWSSAKQLLGDPGLLKRLTYFDKDNIPLKVGMYIIYFKSRYFIGWHVSNVSAPYLFKKDKRHWTHWRRVIPSFIWHNLKIRNQLITSVPSLYYITIFQSLSRLQSYTDSPDFTPENVGKISVACKSMCMWVRAIENYAKVYRYVLPKKQRFQVSNQNRAACQVTSCTEKKSAIACETSIKTKGQNVSLTLNICRSPQSTWELLRKPWSVSRLN